MRLVYSPQKGLSNDFGLTDLGCLWLKEIKFVNNTKFESQ